MEDKTKQQQPDNKIALMEKTIADSVLNRISDLESKGAIQFPPNYSKENALKSAWLMILETVDKDKKAALTVCSKESVYNSLLDMVIQGLTPIKKQCYFIVYGNKLTLRRSYHGTIAVTRRLKGVENVFANIIYEDDVFEYTINQKTGLKEIVKHEQKLENLDNSKIKGAYAVIVQENKPAYIEIMNKKMIEQAWKLGQLKGNGDVHNNFTDMMCRKTVIGRACNVLFNSSDDSDVLIEAIQKTPDVDELPETPIIEIKTEINENANKETIDIKPAEKLLQSETQQPTLDFNKIPPAKKNGKGDKIEQEF